MPISLYVKKHEYCDIFRPHMLCKNIQEDKLLINYPLHADAANLDFNNLQTWIGLMLPEWPHVSHTSKEGEKKEYK